MALITVAVWGHVSFTPHCVYTISASGNSQGRACNLSASIEKCHPLTGSGGPPLRRGALDTGADALQNKSYCWSYKDREYMKKEACYSDVWLMATKWGLSIAPAGSLGCCGGPGQQRCQTSTWVLTACTRPCSHRSRRSRPRQATWWPLAGMPRERAQHVINSLQMLVFQAERG